MIVIKILLRPIIYNVAENLAKACGDYTFELVQA